MFRRRPSTPSSTSTAPRPTLPAGGEAATAPRPGAGLASQLAAAGWVLPRRVTLGGEPRWSLVGTVASETVTAVDPAALVDAGGWGLDWWIGADDRWHLPAREAAVRQQLLEHAPVVETVVRVPGGDAAHRAYGVRAPRPVGDEWVVAEVENRTAIPFAVALVIRPVVADGLGAVGRITVEPVEGGRGRDVAHLVRVDGRPALVVPRRPARLAVGNRAAGDVVEVVTSGAAGEELVAAECPDGLATMALVFPLAHTATLRALLPVGEVGDPVPYPSVVPDAATVASGWEVHRRGPRLEVPELRLATAVERARASIQLAHDGAAVRRDGSGAADLEPGATEVLLGAFDLLDRPAEVGTVVARWPERLADPDPEVDAMLLTVVARHWLLHRVDPFLDWMLPQVAAAVERLDRAHRRGRLAPGPARARCVAGLRDAVRLLTAAGQPDGAGSVEALAARISGDTDGTAHGDGDRATVADRLVALATDLAAGDRSAPARLDAELAGASPTGSWPGPGPHGRVVGQDLAAAAALVHAARALLVAERPDGLALLPVHPDGWYGAGVEVHDLPTESGRLSYAVRWHGTRPALLWDLVPHPGTGPVMLTAPGLDPHWSTTEPRGETLLAEVPPPEGLEPQRLVAEHPDIDPAMRRPGAAPAGPTPPSLPDGGSFS